VDRNVADIVADQTAAADTATPDTPHTEVQPPPTVTEVPPGVDDPDFRAESVKSFGSGMMPQVPTPPVKFPSQVRTLPPGLLQDRPNPFYGALQGTTTKNVENASTVTVVRDITQDAFIQAAVQAAVTCHANDPKAAAIAVSEAIRGVQQNLRNTTSQWGTNQPVYGEVGNSIVRDKAPNSQNSRAAEAILLGSISTAPGGNDKHKDPTRLYKTFPIFPGDKCRYEPGLWKTFWEEVATFKTVTNCDDDFIAIMIKDQADRNKNTELHSSIQHLRHSDGTFKEAGYTGVVKCLTEDFAPKGHTLKVKTRERVMKHMFRRFKENPKWWFRRADEWIKEAKDQDAGFMMSDDQLAEIWLHNSGLNLEEKKEVYKLSNYEHDPQKIRDNILQEYENAREFDQRRVMKGRLNHKLRKQGHPHKVYKVSCPDTGEPGTDLTREDVEEYDEFEDLDPTVKIFDPSNPVMLSTVYEDHDGSYGEVNDDGYGTDQYNDDEGPSQACAVYYTASPYCDDDEEDDQEEDDTDTEEECESDSSEEEDEEDEEIKEDLATNIFVTGYEHGRRGAGMDVEEDDTTRQAHVFVATLRDARKMNKSKDKSKTDRGVRKSNRGKKSDSHFKPKRTYPEARPFKGKPYNKDGKPKKGKRRMLSGTRGYTPTTSKATDVKFEGGIPFDPTHTKLECRMCKNKDTGGNKVLGHLPGAPICPLVRNGTKSVHPRWADLCKEKGIKLAKPTAKGSGKGFGKSSGKGRTSDGRFQSRDSRPKPENKPYGTFMLNSTSPATQEFHDPNAFNKVALCQEQSTALVVQEPTANTIAVTSKWDLVKTLEHKAVFLWPMELSTKQSKNLMALTKEECTAMYGETWGNWKPPAKCQFCENSTTVTKVGSEFLCYDVNGEVLECGPGYVSSCKQCDTHDYLTQSSLHPKLPKGPPEVLAPPSTGMSSHPQAASSSTEPLALRDRQPNPDDPEVLSASGHSQANSTDSWQLVAHDVKYKELLTNIKTLGAKMQLHEDEYEVCFNCMIKAKNEKVLTDDETLAIQNILDYPEINDWMDLMCEYKEYVIGKQREEQNQVEATQMEEQRKQQLRLERFKAIGTRVEQSERSLAQVYTKDVPMAPIPHLPMPTAPPLVIAPPVPAPTHLPMTHVPQRTEVAGWIPAEQVQLPNVPQRNTHSTVLASSSNSTVVPPNAESRPATEIDVQALQSRVQNQVRQVVASQTADIMRTRSHTTHAATAARAPTNKEAFLRGNLTPQQRKEYSHAKQQYLYEEWKKEADKAQQEKTRNTLGMTGPTIDLNNCPMDTLDVVARLTLTQKKAIMLTRSKTNTGFTSWEDMMKRTPGIGPVTVGHLRTFCKDPSTTPVLTNVPTVAGTQAAPTQPDPDVTEANQVLVATVMENHNTVELCTEDLSTVVTEKAIDQTLNRLKKIPKLPLTQALMTQLLTEVKNFIQIPNYVLKVDLAKAGWMWADSGCNKGVGGDKEHAKWKQFLKELGLKPLMVRKTDEFIFGNGETTYSDCLYIYPVFFNNQFCGGLEQAQIPKPCPMLFSKTTLKDWKCNVDFEKEETNIRKHHHTEPFQNGTPYVDIFGIDPSTLDRSQIPPRFWLESEEVVHDTVEEALMCQAILPVIQ